MLSRQYRKFHLLYHDHPRKYSEERLLPIKRNIINDLSRSLIGATVCNRMENPRKWSAFNTYLLRRFSIEELYVILLPISISLRNSINSVIRKHLENCNQNMWLCMCIEHWVLCPLCTNDQDDFLTELKIQYMIEGLREIKCAILTTNNFNKNYSWPAIFGCTCVITAILKICPFNDEAKRCFNCTIRSSFWQTNSLAWHPLRLFGCD